LPDTETASSPSEDGQSQTAATVKLPVSDVTRPNADTTTGSDGEHAKLEIAEDGIVDERGMHFGDNLPPFFSLSISVVLFTTFSGKLDSRVGVSYCRATWPIGGADLRFFGPQPVPARGGTT